MPNRSEDAGDDPGAGDGTGAGDGASAGALARAPAQPWGAGKVRPTQPEPRPPAVARLGVWWVVALAIVVGVAWAATDHFLRATVTLAVGCLVGALLRLVLPPERAGGLVIRSRVADVLVLTVLGVALLATGFALDLRARV